MKTAFLLQRQGSKEVSIPNWDGENIPLFLLETPLCLVLFSSDRIIARRFVGDSEWNKSNSEFKDLGFKIVREIDGVEFRWFQYPLYPYAGFEEEQDLRVVDLRAGTVARIKTREKDLGDFISDRYEL